MSNKKKNKRENNLDSKKLSIEATSKLFGGKYQLSSYKLDGKQVTDSWNDTDNDGLWDSNEKGICTYDGRVYTSIQ
ncbi:hypothetical protein KRE40_01910 [Elizabethkingia meningoseptica]|uniref:hypothetical protein n=1 Tax=Elizabethkingia meningoseptica TaxID=238 RepID=UPI000332CAB7|nr:hypothetical protein [Elizabethkingia meningoseptica]AQX05411.1 hypothetical protein BBD33_09200 [Elizabethkingia meningoseptica]AQX47452.1 hypothetical protein B5G46_09190 [Elizabethkingia meningoseptica]EOR29696.1 hypothetical protein L100_09739 [Elizabethkingia meningoseptica ATCC 13253 = NBRC 12535]KUY24282.1 hypothetical protein ATB99_01915 [Elizabethkingia meningoseptica]MDE5437498.1 hypothetical protein [Elizabethkingia meningoseptica]